MSKTTSIMNTYIHRPNTEMGFPFGIPSKTISQEK